jgi:hypothetical protein
MAQAVYSVNIVGYVNQTIPQGASMVANQLNNSPDNKVATVLATAPEGTAFFKFIPATGGYAINQVVDGVHEGDDLNMTLNPGEGIFISSPVAFTATFVGEVKTGTTSTPLRTGYSVVSSQIPQAGGLVSALGFQAEENDTVFQFVPSNGSYIITSFIDGAWEGGVGEPTLRIGEPFFFQNSSPIVNRAWTRNFIP